MRNNPEANRLEEWGTVRQDYIVAKLIELFGRLDAEQLLAAHKGDVVTNGNAPEDRHADVAGLFSS